MLMSMTGFGTARKDTGEATVVVEVRSVNGRFLKTNFKVPASLSGLEAQLETLVKKKLRRGSVTVNVFITTLNAEQLVRINESVVRAYQATFARLGLNTDCIPTLPGVVDRANHERTELPFELLSVVESCTQEALEQLCVMRAREGKALVELLTDLCTRLDTECAAVRERAPAVVIEYQQRLHTRIAQLLGGVEGPVDPQFLAREVAIFADRCDITEEVDRLGAHLDQVRGLLQAGGEAGRTLEFLAQEMHREVNTMGSKSADSELSRHVVCLKSDVERFKEQVANVE